MVESAQVGLARVRITPLAIFFHFSPGPRCGPSRAGGSHGPLPHVERARSAASARPRYGPGFGRRSCLGATPGGRMSAIGGHGVEEARESRCDPCDSLSEGAHRVVGREYSGSSSDVEGFNIRHRCVNDVPQSRWRCIGGHPDTTDTLL
jgi:hypothetical protein